MPGFKEQQITCEENNELRISEYSLELEQNSTKSRVGFFVSKTLSYVRRIDLEGKAVTPTYLSLI